MSESGPLDAGPSAQTPPGSGARTLAGGGALRLLSSGISLIGAFFVSVVLIRTLGIARYGIYATVLGIVRIAGTFGDLGIGTAISRMGSYYEGEEVFSWARASLRLSIRAGLLLTAVVVAVVPFVPATSRIALLAASPLVFMEIVRSAQGGFLVARRKVLIFEGTIVGIQIAMFALIFLLIVTDLSSVPTVLFAQVATRAAGVLILGLAWRRITRDQEIGIAPAARKILAFSVPLMMGSLSAIVLSRSDVIMLAAFRGSKAAGLYAPILNIFDVTPLIVLSIGSYLMPIGSALVRQGNYDRLREAYTSLAKWAMVLTLPLLVTLFLLPTPILTAFFGDGFAHSGNVVRVLAVAYTVNVISGANNVILIVLGATKQIMYRSLVLMVLNLAVNLVLIPRFGAIGAAIGTSTVMILVNVSNSLFIWKAAKVHPIRRDTFLLVASVTVAALVAALAIKLAVLPEGLLGAVEVLALTAVVGLSVALLTLRPYESALVRSSLARLGLGTKL